MSFGFRVSGFGFGSVAMALLLAACGTAPQRPPAERAAVPPGLTLPKPVPKGGGYYQDDGPGERIPDDLAAVPDAEPRDEPLHRYANRPYTVLGRDYVPMRELRPYRARGVASWYGRKFHGQKTSSGEPYDMFAMTAAHPTLPIPSYARVTNLANGKAVVVRVNDRGPFLHGRIIDLSYAAAWKLGYIGAGSATVEVESVLPGAAPPADPPADTLQAAAPPATALPPVQDLRGIFLQLGAFGSRGNAESFRARLAGQLDWLTETIHVHDGEGLFRLHLGPYPDLQAAGRIAERIRAALSLDPFVIQR